MVLGIGRGKGALALTVWAVKRAAPALNAAFDGRVADVASLTLSPVNGEAMLEVTESAVGLAVIAQGGSTRLNGFREYVLDMADKAFRLGNLQTTRASAWANSGSEKCFAHIDISETGYDPLIQQGDLDGRFLAFQTSAQVWGVPIIR